jgi:VWFA-related protein
MPFFSFRLGNRLGSVLCFTGFALGLLCLAMATTAQQSASVPPDAGQQASTLSITTREVLLDVVVTDSSGHPLTGLKASDFKVTEEGELQRLTHLEEHHSMSAESLSRLKSGPALPPNTFTNFTPVQNTNSSTVILLDALNTSLDAQMELRQQLIDAVKHIQPGTPVALFQIDTEMRLIQGFTADPQVLLEAAKSKRDMISLQRPVRGSRDEYRRARFDILRSGFQLMGRYLSGFPGRKNLIWLTGSVPQSYMSDPLGTSFGRSFRDDFTILENDPLDLTDALTLSRVAVYPIDARGLLTPPQYAASNIRGPSPGANLRFEGRQAFQHMDLDTIAEATGGKAYYNTNGLKEVIVGIVDNGSNYYTLAYATTNKTWNGQFRHIKVALGRPGVRMQYRQGYYAVDRAKQEQRLLAALQRKKARAANNPFGEDEAATQEAPPASAPASAAPPAPEGAGALIQHPKGGFEASMQLGAIPPTEAIFTASISVGDKVEKLDKKAPLPLDNYLEEDYKGKPFRTYTVQIHLDAHALRLARTAAGMRHGQIEFVTLVYDQNGNRVNSLFTTAELNVSEEHYRKLLLDGLPVRQEIAIPVKGNYFLRIGVHDAASDHIGALEIPVDQIRAGVPGQSLLKP